MPDVKATGKCVKTDSEKFQNQAVIKLRIIFYGKKITLSDQAVIFQVLRVFCLLPFCVCIKIVDQRF